MVTRGRVRAYRSVVFRFRGEVYVRLLKGGRKGNRR